MGRRGLAPPTAAPRSERSSERNQTKRAVLIVSAALPERVERLLLLQRVAELVLRLADRILCGSDRLFDGAFRTQLVVAGDFAGGFLDGTCGLLGGAFDPVGAHGVILSTGDDCIGREAETTPVLSLRSVGHDLDQRARRLVTSAGGGRSAVQLLAPRGLVNGGVLLGAGLRLTKINDVLSGPPILNLG